MNYDDKCQLLIIGNSTVGKTSILSKYASKMFNENYIATVGLDFFTKDETIDNKIIRIKIWDTAGQERYKALTKCFFQKAQGVMVVFDVTNQKSFDDLKFWLDTIKTHIYDDDYVPIVIIGNKIDLQKRVVPKKDAIDFAEKNNYHYYETSAKTGDGVDNAIKELVKSVMNNVGKKNGRENLRLSLNKKKSGKCC
jgi:Ras-related protein Rab-1A